MNIYKLFVMVERYGTAELIATKVNELPRRLCGKINKDPAGFGEAYPTACHHRGAINAFLEALYSMKVNRVHAAWVVLLELIAALASFLPE